MTVIYIDGQEYEVKEGENLLHVALSLGLDVPYFCWHPALGSVGSCRLCAVKQFEDKEDTEGQVVMACMTPVQEGGRFSVADPEAVEFRRAVLEWLMTNHPHDCPICDEGGECHLQDMTVMTGHTYRRFRFKKRTYRNQYLGPLINHEMNRCIQCYRCVRFYNDYAGGDDLQALAAHNHVYFGRHQDGVLESAFSGNLVEVCPTGVFTDKTLKQHYTRKWDLQTAPSICVHCGVGCNTIPGERYGQLRRIRSRYNGEVNCYFLCDRGRYGYEFVNSEQRLRRPLIKQEVAGREEALARLGEILSRSQKVIGIGSPRASLEANFALRSLVGPANFYAGIPEQEHRLLTTIIQVLQQGPARTPSLQQMQQADAVLVLGEDLPNTAPMMALALRQAVRQQPMQIPRSLQIPDWQDAAVREAIQQEKGPLFIATPHRTGLDDIARQAYRAAPDDIARLGLAVAHALDPQAPAVPGLADEVRALAETIAEALGQAERPLVISGTGLGSQAVIQAAANVAWALGDPAELAFAGPECNSLGLALLGGRPLEAAMESEAEALVVLENDLYRRLGAGRMKPFLSQAGALIALDHLANPTTLQADLVLPAATFAEGSGTFVNNEGRAQRFYQVYQPSEGVWESWRWLQEAMLAAGHFQDVRWQTLDDVAAALAQTMPAFEPILDIAPPPGFRLVGQKIPRQPRRYSGRTAMRADISVHEPQPSPDPDSPLAFSMEGYQGHPPPSLISRYWAPGWNSVQAVNKFQSEVGGPLHGGDPGRRLIEPEAAAPRRYFKPEVAAFVARPGEWLVVPAYHIFGSEALSLFTPGLAELAPQPYLGLNPQDAERLALAEGQEAVLSLGEDLLRLPVKRVASLPQGVAALPVGLPTSLGFVLPRWGTIRAGLSALKRAGG